MPELPEVEVIARGLRETLPGRRFVHVAATDLRAVPGESLDSFAERVQGRSVAGIRRRGKLLLVDLERDNTPESVLTVHLRMTGRVVHGPDRPCEAHERIRFRMDDGSVLTFADVRRFGACRVFTPDELDRWSFYALLGPEPLEIGSREFAALFQGRKTRVKALLLDQRVLAGVGNIYADESLFRAGIRPDARADHISRTRLARLHGALQDVLAQAIAENGSSISDYRNARGDAGAFQNSFRVYGKAGHACAACGATLESNKVAGRTSTYCPCCQRA
ncbi:MAG: bifunctional DNA-formamidopyrimidine glycosylase/DNA-(apurinic or apyrimidinic site) lyase [Desulfovibrionaceae bacterium]